MIRIQRDAYLQSLELCRIRCNWEDVWHNGEDLLFPPALELIMQLRQSLIRSTSAVLIFGIQLLMGLFSIPGRLRRRRLPRDRQF